MVGAYAGRSGIFVCRLLSRRYVQKNGENHGFHAAIKISFGRVSLPKTKEEEIAQAKESLLRSGNHRGFYVHVTR